MLLLRKLDKIKNWSIKGLKLHIFVYHSFALVNIDIRFATQNVELLLKCAMRFANPKIIITQRLVPKAVLQITMR